MSHVLPLVTATAVVVLSGLVHGLWSNRWGGTEALDRAVARLEAIPWAEIDRKLRTTGAWVGEDGSLPEEQLVQAQLSGYHLRRYASPEGGEVTVLLMCGRPGPVAVHTPDICYRGAGYLLVKEESYPAKEAPFGLLGRFKSTQPLTPGGLAILWTWNAAGTWEAPANPRWRFAAYSALYKLYVVCPTPSTDGVFQDDPRARFMQQLLPELQRALFGDT